MSTDYTWGRYWRSADLDSPAPTRTYTRADLVRAILGQQWAVAIALHDSVTFLPEWYGGETWIDNAGPHRRIASLPSPDDVVTAMEQV